MLWMEDAVGPKCAVKEFIKDFANPTCYISEAEKKSFYLLKSHICGKKKFIVKLLMETVSGAGVPKSAAQ